MGVDESNETTRENGATAVHRAEYASIADGTEGEEDAEFVKVTKSNRPFDGS